MVGANKTKYVVASSILIVLVMVLVVRYINRPAQGTIIYPNTSSLDNSSTNSLTPVSFNTTYASFSYPKVFSTYPAQTPTGQVIADYNFIDHNSEQWFLAISILQIPGGNLNDNNAYEERQIHPNAYRHTVLQVNNQSVNVMTQINTSTYNQSAFLVNNNYQAIVSLSANRLNDPSLQTVFNMLLNSWRWH